MKNWFRLMIVLSVGLMAVACSESSNPLASTGPSASAPQGLSNNAGARFSTMSTRDNPTAPGTQCSSGVVANFKMNPDSTQGAVDVLGNPLASGDANQSYLIGSKRQNNLYPGGYEVEFFHTVSELDVTIFDVRFVPGTWLSRITLVCGRHPTGNWAFNEWGINGDAVYSAPPITFVPPVDEPEDPPTDPEGPPDGRGGGPPEGGGGGGGNGHCNAGGGNGSEGCNPGNSGPGHDEP